MHSFIKTSYYILNNLNQNYKSAKGGFLMRRKRIATINEHESISNLDVNEEIEFIESVNNNEEVTKHGHIGFSNWIFIIILIFILLFALL